MDDQEHITNLEISALRSIIRNLENSVWIGLLNSSHRIQKDVLYQGVILCNSIHSIKANINCIVVDSDTKLNYANIMVIYRSIYINTRPISEAIIKMLVSSIPGMDYSISLFEKLNNPISYHNYRKILNWIFDDMKARHIEIPEILYDMLNIVNYIWVITSATLHVRRFRSIMVIKNITEILSKTCILIDKSYILCKTMCKMLRGYRADIEKRTNIKFKDDICVFDLLVNANCSGEFRCKKGTSCLRAHGLGKIALKHYHYMERRLLSCGDVTKDNFIMFVMINTYDSPDLAKQADKLKTIGVVPKKELPEEAPPPPIDNNYKLVPYEYRYYGGEIPRPSIVLVHGTEWMWYDRRNGQGKQAYPQVRLKKINEDGKYFHPHITSDSYLQFYHIVKKF